MADLFHAYYTALYNLESPSVQSSDLEGYLAESGLGKVSSEMQSLLEEPISEEEAPGPDGLTLAYYKKFSSVLAPNATRALNALLKLENPPADFLRAQITVNVRGKGGYNLP